MARGAAISLRPTQSTGAQIKAREAAISLGTPQQTSAQITARGAALSLGCGLPNLYLLRRASAHAGGNAALRR